MVMFLFRYTGIRVTDLDRALAFYLDVPRMKLVRRVKVPETKGEFAVVRSEDSDHWLEINCMRGKQIDPAMSWTTLPLRSVTLMRRCRI